MACSIRKAWSDGEYPRVQGVDEMNTQGFAMIASMVTILAVTAWSRSSTSDRIGAG
jgi:hypothetical protein